MKSSIIFTTLALLPALAVARSYTPDSLPYSDPPRDLPTQIAISVLTEEEILQGNPDGTIRSGRSINRAEFVKIVMGFVEDDEVAFALDCFPDVDPEVWYSVPVCKAKYMGIVRGNAVEGVDPSEWLFAPERPVQYDEALSVLAEVFGAGLGEVGDGPWYGPLLDFGENVGVDFVANPAHQLTRGEMARVTVHVLADRDAELDMLIAAEKGEEYVPNDEGHAGEEEMEEANAEAEEEEVVEEEEEEVVEEEEEEPAPPKPLVYDNRSDVAVEQNFLLLGSESSPIIGGASIFSEHQPIAVEKLIVRLFNSTQSIDALLIFNEDRELIGNAHIDGSFPGSRQYVLDLKPGDLTLEKGEKFTFYARARMREFDAGGVSGDIVQVEKMGLEGDGVWNSKTQTEFTTEDYVSFQTARSVVTDISNAAGDFDVLLAGTQLRLGSFRFKGEEGKGDGSADLAVTDLTMTINQTGGVGVTNVMLGADGTSDKVACASAGSTITCNGIPEKFGSFESVPRILTLYGDVTIPSGASNAGLQLAINDPGSVLAPGAVTWTDGTTIFQWVPGNYPVAKSTYFSL